MASDGHHITHPWHVQEPSALPLIGSAAALVAAIGAVDYFHNGSFVILSVGLLGVLFIMYRWWALVVHEAEVGKHHTLPVQTMLRWGMILFIASEVMFFFAFFWAYFHSSIPALNVVASPAWPPQGIEPLYTWGLPFLNTVILLTSGATVTYAHHALLKGKRGGLIFGLILTVALGVLFLVLQAHEYGVAAFGLGDGIYPSTFYLATGFHGFHVFIGTVFLFVCLVRAIKGQFTPTQHVGFEAAAWYWHFVDVVWLFLFCFVYWWGSAGYNFG